MRAWVRDPGDGFPTRCGGINRAQRRLAQCRGRVTWGAAITPSGACCNPICPGCHWRTRPNLGREHRRRGFVIVRHFIVYKPSLKMRSTRRGKRGTRDSKLSLRRLTPFAVLDETGARGWRGEREHYVQGVARRLARRGEGDAPEVGRSTQVVYTCLNPACGENPKYLCFTFRVTTMERVSKTFWHYTKGNPGCEGTRSTRGYSRIRWLEG